ncbi:hypothetical protein HDV00_009927, partial [Rhizophlyctis rosea]
MLSAVAVPDRKGSLDHLHPERLPPSQPQTPVSVTPPTIAGHRDSSEIGLAQSDVGAVASTPAVPERDRHRWSLPSGELHFIIGEIGYRGAGPRWATEQHGGPGDLLRSSTHSPPLLPRTQQIPAPPNTDQTLSEDHLLDPNNLTLCITTYPYAADKNDELSFTEGKIIRVVRKVEGGWWEGQLDQRVGWFPANHVEEYVLTGDVDEQIGPFANSSGELNQLRLRTIWLNNELQGFSHEKSASPATNLEDVAEASVKRMRAVQDMMTAEKHYLMALDRMLHEFVYGLRNEDWFPEKDHSIIFANLDEVADAQHDLMSSLEADTEMIGRTYLSKCERLGYVYNDYCSNLPRAITSITKYGQDPLMSRFLQNTSASQSSPPILHLVSSLHKPAQWMQRCITMLHQILSNTDTAHPDHRYVEMAIEEIRNVLQHIEKTKKARESKEIIRHLMRRLDGWDGPSLDRYGELVLEGSLKVHEGVRKRERTFYLLEKMLIVVRTDRLKAGDGVRYKLQEAVLMGREVVLGVVDATESDNDATSLSFSVTFLTEELRTRTLSITAFNIDQKRRWLSAIHHRLTSNPPLPRPLPTSSDTTRSSSSGQSQDHKPRKRNWFKAIGQKIMKKRPSVLNLKDLADSDSVSVAGGEREGGEGNLVAKILRRKDTKEKLRVRGYDQGGGDDHAKGFYPSSGSSLGAASSTLQRLRPPSHHHHGSHTSSGPSEGTSSTRSSMSGMKRTSLISTRSNRSGSRCASPPPPCDMDGGNVPEPPPPLPPLPKIVMESLARRARSMELVGAVREGEAPGGGIVRANSDGDVGVKGGGPDIVGGKTVVAPLTPLYASPIQTSPRESGGGGGREIRAGKVGDGASVSPPGTPDSGLWIRARKRTVSRETPFVPKMTVPVVGQQVVSTAASAGVVPMTPTPGTPQIVKPEVTRGSARRSFEASGNGVGKAEGYERSESKWTPPGQAQERSINETVGEKRPSMSAPTSPRMRPKIHHHQYTPSTPSTPPDSTHRSKPPAYTNSPSADTNGSFLIASGRPVARSHPASPKRKSSAAAIVGSVKRDLAGMFKRTKSSDAVSAMGPPPVGKGVGAVGRKGSFGDLKELFR